MRSEQIIPEPDPDSLSRVPSWITARHGETPGNVSFLSGAALAHLNAVLTARDIPMALLRERLALTAAEACVARSGRPERAGELRDALHLLRPGDLPGPAGEVYQSWQRAVRGAISVKGLHRALPLLEPAHLAEYLDTGAGDPVSRAATVLEAVLTANPRHDVPALILADAVIARGLGWDHVMPLMAQGMKRADLALRGEALCTACHAAVTATAIRAVGVASDLARRAAHLRQVTPKLRAKAAGAAVEMVLSRDAVAPSALPLPDRAARRLCDRLVTLGALRELTGRDTFRLYGV